MPAWYQIKFLPDGIVEDFFASRGNQYQLADGSTLEIRTRPVWCRQCSAFTEGEAIQSLEEIDQRICDYENPQSQSYPRVEPGKADPGNLFRKEILSEWIRRRQWREGRIAPPKCLKCGTTDIQVLPFNEAIPSPCSSGTLIVESVGMCSTPFNNKTFTSEGARIKKKMGKPTYWKPPRSNLNDSATTQVGETANDELSSS